jgi:hypothetical protein
MFLTGSPQSFQDLFSEKASLPSSGILETSILHPVLLIIKDWAKYRNTKPVVLASSIYLLFKLWERGNSHKVTLEKLRVNDALWISLMELVKSPTNYLPEPPCSNYCYFQFSQAYSLKVLVLEARFGLYESAVSDCTQLTKDLFSTLNIVAFASTISGKGLLEVTFPYNPQITTDAASLLDDTNLGLSLIHSRSIVWNDPFDSTRPYGYEFVYDTNLLFRKIELSTGESLVFVFFILGAIH